MKKVKLRKTFKKESIPLNQLARKKFVKELIAEKQTFSVHELPTKDIVEIESDFSAN